MRERDRLALRAQREEIEAEERAERERIEAPIRAAEAKFKETSRAIALAIRERIANGKDDEIYVSPDLVGAKMSQEQAARHNATSGKVFLERNPWFYNSPANIHALIQYFLRNSTNIIDADMWERAAKRLAEFNLFPDYRPEPEPEPEPEVETERQPPEPPKPEVFEGWDLQSGEPRTYTRREVDRMGADEYRRVFRIYRDHLSLPNVGPGARY